jgi:hypothetical protein
MTAEPSSAGQSADAGKRLWWVIPLCALLVVAAAAFAAWRGTADRQSDSAGASVAEKLGALRTDRIALQARADGDSRLWLFEEFRLASLLTDGLAARYGEESERGLASLPAAAQRTFAEAAAFNATIKEALDHPGEGARLMVRAAAPQARAALERLAEGGDGPLVLAITPRFVPPRLALGDWHGDAVAVPGRLRFTLPRAAFAAAAVRTAWANATLSMRSGTRTLTFQLLFLVLPDRLGSFALDQKVKETVTESKTLASPEILVRASGGETRTLRRCFDPPPGWRFDKERRRVVIVERLGWLDDVPDATLNGGSVEFAPDETARQICVNVTAKPVTASAGARTATIGRFEATLLHDLPADRVVKSGVRALDWREPVRLPIEAGTTDQKLYLHLFDEVDIEIDGMASRRAPFVRVDVDKAQKTIVLTADPAAEP